MAFQSGASLGFRLSKPAISCASVNSQPKGGRGNTPESLADIMRRVDAPGAGSVPSRARLDRDDAPLDRPERVNRPDRRPPGVNLLPSGIPPPGSIARPVNAEAAARPFVFSCSDIDPDCPGNFISDSDIEPLDRIHQHVEEEHPELAQNQA